MKTSIILTIEPHEDGLSCIGCEFIGLNGSQWWCRLYSDYVGFYAKPPARIPRCLAAEQRLRDLIAAGDEMQVNPSVAKREAWDAAKKRALEEGR